MNNKMEYNQFRLMLLNKLEQEHRAIAAGTQSLLLLLKSNSCFAKINARVVEYQIEECHARVDLYEAMLLTYIEFDGHTSQSVVNLFIKESRKELSHE